ncbi:monovalent cation/H+ antiporter complex subunit F [Rothia sp. (in: high G+C Gram-positive bacteria)]|uniref:monovalent cation/H+ antiporter complex subunit F n=1 Tax=Rothia sp. (in: high G+C Gram-positive bacteria) TaxID=1885016 RepID=UPI003216EA36
MTWAIWATGLILTLATWGTVYRVWKGPALLDRVLASDVLLSILTAALCVLMIYTDSQFFLILLVALAMIGFVGSVTVARFADNSKADERTPVSRLHEGRSRKKGSKYAPGELAEDTDKEGQESAHPVRASKDLGE